MKTKHLILLFNLVAFLISAQPENAHWEGQSVDAGKSYFLYGNNVSLREAPNQDANKIASLAANEYIEVLEVTDKTHFIYGKESPWVKVRAAGKLEGYLVSGLIAVGSRTLADGSVLLYTRAKSDETSYSQIMMRRMLNEKIFDLGTFDLANDSFGINLHDSRGLKNINHILEIDYLAEACGEEGGRAYFAMNLDEENLLPLGLYSSVGDGGMFHQSENLIFPDDKNGTEGIIIYEGEEGAENEDTGEYRTVSKVKHYSWSDVSDGKKIEPFTYN